MDLKTIDVDDVVPPNRSDKLHPHEDEDEESWEDFRNSVGVEPQKPIEVRKQNGSYEIIDGDRRFRAVQENGAEQVTAFVVSEDSEEGRLTRMVRANEFREPSNKKQRARHIAQLTAPWLLPPGERKGLNTFSQQEIADEIGMSKATVSVWMRPVRDQYPLRDVLSKTVSGRSLTEEDVSRIDNIVDLLVRGGDSNKRVISTGQERFVSEELAEMSSVSLSELETVAEKAAEDGWDSTRMLEYLRNNYAAQDLGVDEDELDSGMLDGTDFEDDSVTDPVDVDNVEAGSQNEKEETDFGMPEMDVDWSEHVSDDDLGSESLGSLKNRQMMTQTIEDDAAIAINILCAKTGMSQREVIKKFVEPTIVDQTVGYLSSE